MEEKLSRNFLVVTELSTYYEVILKKMEFANLSNRASDLEVLFASLANLQKTNEKRFEKVLANLSSFTEGYVVTHSRIFSKLVEMPENEEQQILEENKCAKDESIFALINKMDNSAKALADSWVNSIIVETGKDETAMKEVLDNMSDVNNKDLIGSIFTSLVEEYPNVGKISVLSDYLVDLVGSSYKLAHNELRDELASTRKAKDYRYESYRQKQVIRAKRVRNIV